MYLLKKRGANCNNSRRKRRKDSLLLPYNIYKTQQKDKTRRTIICLLCKEPAPGLILGKEFYSFASLYIAFLQIVSLRVCCLLSLLSTDGQHWAKHPIHFQLLSPESPSFPLLFQNSTKIITRMQKWWMRLSRLTKRSSFRRRQVALRNRDERLYALIKPIKPPPHHLGRRRYVFLVGLRDASQYVTMTHHHKVPYFLRATEKKYLFKVGVWLSHIVTNCT